jgi:RND family efflux transporter MFP subunit
MNKRRIVLLILLLIAVVGGLVWYYYLQGNEKDLLASGSIEATEVTVSSKVVAKVLEIKVDEGDRVKENDVLAELDSRELKEALKSAQARYRIAKESYERDKKLYAAKTISSQEFDQSSSNLQVAEAALETARIQFDCATIRAPLAGVVLVKAIEKGELATIGSPIATIGDLDKVKLTVYLSEKDVGRVKLGEAVPVSVDSFPDEKFMGKVIYLSDQAEFTPKAIQTRDERTTLVYGVKIEIPNPELKLKPGMPADADFRWNSQ